MTRSDPRVGEILALIQRVAAGDLRARLDPSEAGDDLDAIAEGLNMLAEEVKASTVSIDRYSTLVAELQAALADVKTLSGMLPICAWCRQVRNDKGYWTELESFISEHSGARFTHGICPTCVAKTEREADDAEQWNHDDPPKPRTGDR